jgi:site-specific DNA recombinase
MATRYTSRNRTRVRTSGGLWPMARPPGPDCRWIILTRRSKYNADGTEGSTRRQEDAVRNHLLANNMGKVGPVYSEIVSAYRKGAKREGFEAALADIEAGRADAIAVWKIDRLCRRVSQYRRVLDVLESKGARLFSLVEGIDTADPERKFVNGLILDLLVRLAEMESEGTSERLILMAQDRASQRKHHGGGTRPFGHTVGWDAVVPKEADAIRDAAKRVLKGEGAWSIVRDWNANGPRPVKTEQWSTKVLTGILLQPRLVAKRDYGGELFDLEDVPPILDVETWERVCARLAEPKPQAGSTHTSRLLSRLAVCGRCQVPLRGGKEMLSRGGHGLYACPPISNGEGSCGRLAVRSHYVDEIVTERVVEWLSDKRNVTNLLALHAHGPEDEATVLQIADKNEALSDLGRALKERKIRYSDYEVLYNETLSERKELERQLTMNRDASLLAETLTFEDVAAEWGSRPQTWRRAILKLATKRIVVEPVGKTTGARKGQSGFGFDPERVRVTFADE